MQDWILAQQVWLRLGAFAGVLALLLVAERLAPRRAGPMRRELRWPANLGIIVVDWIVLKLLLPLGAVGAAAWAARSGFGLFHRVGAPPVLAFAASFLALDCLIYWQHRILHMIPALWRLHRMHHSDVEFDATTALRFHPGEIVLSMLVKMGAVALLGAPVVAVLAFEIALNATAMFNHSNLRLPAGLDRALRLVLVTPDMHRVHHSVHRREHDTNFGFNLPWWDWLFRSYTRQPAEGHALMTIGLAEFRRDEDQRLVRLLRQPLA